MKTAGQQSETTSAASSKIKLGCCKSEMLKHGKQRHIRSGKANVDCSERLFLPPVQPSTSQISVRKTKLHETAPVNSTVLPCQSPYFSGKLKLQLFPIDEATQKGLEQDQHNPYLELTLSTRKKISSVVKHLTIKWGGLKYATGELMLFPYNARLDNILGLKRWTSKNSDITAADVHAAVGNPSIFRLRYGWFSHLEPMTCGTPLTSLHSEDDILAKERLCDENKPNYPVTCDEKVNIDGSFNRGVGTPVLTEKSVQALDNQNKPAALSWIDCISNVSFGALLSETSPSTDGNPLHSQKNLSLHQIPVNCDSFDAAIAAFVSRQQTINQPTRMSNSSIWDAEETCHAFPFQNATSSSSGPASCKDVPIVSSPQNVSSDSVELNDKVDNHDDVNKEPKEYLKPYAKDLHDDGHHSPDSLGPLEHTALCSRHPSADSIGLGGLISSSLDAFQNFSIL
ncbi:TSL-kinase interacting protein 1-like [Typha latifolia]|uniref:TSL-kinase interacting protein 1-like n=1 Tax=Typha latifolia TaxID=4733 RepID=UPI003C2AC5A2